MALSRSVIDIDVVLYEHNKDEQIDRNAIH
jgi:hypothetical protein